MNDNIKSINYFFYDLIFKKYKTIKNNSNVLKKTNFLKKD